ncbi:hypothetical protein RvY_05992 [Ramazzottius varieornatus]|uniref:Uncharacterized protein n=1 Tax=Ramazzottius varieornatus TaxID=947166 RepID=A0A1D1V3H7_RAMVA|nr:hypothetical protein RvY_05992 [Ramazzottius varieornatus]
MCTASLWFVFLVLCVATCLAIPFADPRLPSRPLDDMAFAGYLQLPDKRRPMAKRRWLFPTQNSQKNPLAALYPSGDCGDEFGNMLNQFRRLPKGKGRDDMVAALFSYCTGRPVK